MIGQNDCPGLHLSIHHVTKVQLVWREGGPVREHEETASRDTAREVNYDDIYCMYLNFPFFISEEYSLSAFSRANCFTNNLSISDCSGAGNCRIQ